MAKQKDHKKEVELEGNVISSEDECAELRQQLEESRKQADQFKNQYLRALADYKNLEHRMDAMRSQMRENITRQVIEEFLPILDNIDQAEIFTKDPGLQMISNSFRQTLQRLGVSEIELIDTEFDPHTAEVVEVVEGNTDDIIVEILQKAYALNGTVIRPGRVKVSKVSK